MRRIGDFRHRMQIQRYVETEKASHGTNKTYTTIATVYADIKNVSGLVQFDTQQIGKGITHKITIRYYPGLNTEHWLLMQSRRFRIRTVTNIEERKRFMLLLCEEVFHAQDGFEVGIDAMGDSLIEDFPLEDA